MSTMPPADVSCEQDSRFPSGPWRGFFLQPMLPGRHWMDLELTFRDGLLRGEGQDWVGPFVIAGRYETSDGKCWWTKRYVGRHEVFYKGYNEGKGIWGTWAMAEGRGGFHIWPLAMGDLSTEKLTESVPEPMLAEVLAP